MGTTKSPSTGYSVTDYVKMVFGHLQMSNTKFAKRVGVTLAQVMRWLREEAEPAMANLWRMEEISGMLIKDYLPEVERGWKLLNTAREWRDGFVRSRMRAKGVQISQGRYRDALNGIVNDERLSANQLIKINNYYEWWRDEKGRKKSEYERRERQRLARLARRTNGQVEHCKKLLARRQSLVDATGEEYAILDIYYRVMGTSGADDFNLRRIVPKIWACETEHYRVEFDLDKEEIRVFWKETGELSFRRDFRAIA